MTVMLVALAAAGLGWAVWFFARRRAGYSHWRDTLSELGETGSVDGRKVSLRVFLPVGLLLLTAGALLQPQRSAAALLAFCVACGYLGAAVFPCDRGSPLDGSLRQWLHNLAGGVQYAGGAIALMQLAQVHDSATYRAAGMGVMLALVVFSVPAFWSVRGLVQRMAELLLFASLLLAAA